MEKEKPVKPFHPKGGRYKIDPKLALSKRVKLNMNEQEYGELMEAFRDSGMNKMAEYLRVRFFKTKEMYVVNPKEILKQLNSIGTEIGRIGNNINQLANYAHTLNINRSIDPVVMEELNSHLLDYVNQRKELTKAIRSLLQKENRHANN